MKVFYDSHTDTLSLILKDNVAVHESDEDKPGVILALSRLRFSMLRSESQIPARSIFNWLNNRWTDPVELLKRGRVDPHIVAVPAALSSVSVVSFLHG